MKQVFLSPKQLAFLMNWFESEDIEIQEDEVKKYLALEEDFIKPEVASRAESFDDAYEEWSVTQLNSPEEKAAIEKMIEFATGAGEDEIQGMFLRVLEASISCDYEYGTVAALKALAEIVKKEESEE